MPRRYCKPGAAAYVVVGGVKVTAEEGLVVLYLKEDRLVFGVGEARVLAAIVRNAGNPFSLSDALLAMAGASLDDMATAGRGPGNDSDAPERVTKSDLTGRGSYRRRGNRHQHV